MNCDPGEWLNVGKLDLQSCVDVISQRSCSNRFFVHSKADGNCRCIVPHTDCRDIQRLRFHSEVSIYEIGNHIKNSSQIESKHPAMLLTSSGVPLQKRSEGFWKSARFFTFDWNKGRLNNQLRSLETAMAYSWKYNRTLWLRFSTFKNDWTGIHYGLFDIEHMRKICDIVLHVEVPNEIRQAYLEEKCKVNKGIEDKISRDVLEECKRIHFDETEYSYFSWDTVTKGLIEGAIRPAKYIRDAVDINIKKHFPKGIRIGVHDRIMREGGPDENGVPYFCRQKGRTVDDYKGEPKYKKLRILIKKFSEDEYGLNAEPYRLSCAMNFSDINYILKYFKQATIKPKEKFFVGADDTDPKIVQNLLDHGAIMWKQDTFLPYSRAKEIKKIQIGFPCTEFGYCATIDEIQKVESALFDMWTLASAEFFVGSWLSTFTETICQWRAGFNHRITKSSLCGFTERWEKAIETQEFV